MSCPKCGASIHPDQHFCSKCGVPASVVTDSYAEKSSAPAEVYTPTKPNSRKRSPLLTVLAIILILASGAGFYYGFTDNAKLVGKWNCEEGYENRICELDAFGKVNMSFGGEPDQPVSGTYSLHPNHQVVFRIDHQNLLANYELKDGSKQWYNRNADETLTRKDPIPFYWIVLAVSGVIAAAGIAFFAASIRPEKEEFPVDSFESPVSAEVPATPEAETPAPAEVPATPEAETPAPEIESRVKITMRKSPGGPSVPPETAGFFSRGGDL